MPMKTVNHGSPKPGT